MTSGSGDIAAALESGYRLHMAGKLDEARACYEDVLRRAPRHARTLALLGALSLQTGDVARAVERLGAAVEVDPRDAGSWSNLGAAYSYMGRPDAAMRAYRKALELDPRHANTWNNLGALLRARGEPAQAANAFREALKLVPEDWGCRRALAATLIEQGDPWQAARELGRAAEVAEGEPDVWAELAGALTEIDDLHGAEQAWRRVLDLVPNDPRALAGLAASLRSQERYEDAAESLDRAITALPRDPRLWMARGNVMLSAGRPGQAAEAFKKALELEPGHLSARLNLGIARIKADRPGEAAEIFASLRADYPSLAKISYYQGLAALNDGDIHRALDFFEESLSHDSLHINSLWYRSHCLRELARHEEVREVLDPEGSVHVSEPLGDRPLEERRAFLEELTRYVVEYPLFRWEPVGSTTRGGFQTPTLPPHEAQVIRTLREFIARGVAEFVESLPPDHLVRRHWPEDWSLSVWGTILHRGGHQRPHVHPGGILSGVFYTQLPPVTEDNPNAGWIEFGGLIYDTPASYEPWTRRVEPEPGRLVIFPSYMPHSTVPFDADERRVSVAFDVMPNRAD